MEAAAGLLKLKPGTEATIEHWKATLQARSDEVVSTLRNEGVHIESWFQIEINGEKYLLWYMKAESISKAIEVAVSSDHDIDQFHFTMMNEVVTPDGNIQAKPALDFAVEENGAKSEVETPRDPS
ncbi:DUF6176 family protein [Pelagibius sp.]|uniref:DUF6176 family protein n=1 Tax=Pelagibius sp. TaxID=1931238 RepID=UPI003BAFD66F